MADKYAPRPEQSTQLLQELHILTREGKLNQDTRRKLKQVQHLLGFIAPLLAGVCAQRGDVHLIDHGAGKSYLGFLLYDAYFKSTLPKPYAGTVTGVETRGELVRQSAALADRLGFAGMRFLQASVSQSQTAHDLPPRIDIVTALHACDTATDDAIAFGLAHHARHMVLVPCCQAEVAACLRQNKPQRIPSNPLAELWRRPIHMREIGSQLTNVLRCLQLESHGYQVTVTELVGWEHSMKNELIVASKPDPASGTSASASAHPRADTRAHTPSPVHQARLQALLQATGLEAALGQRFDAAAPPHHG